MTDRDSRESFEDWIPGPDDPDAERFKWGWSAADGEVVWRVGGPGDGFPAHAEQLRVAWGREPNPSAGDVLGAAEYQPSRVGEPAAVVIHAYYGALVPEAVADWFRNAFPEAQVRLTGAE